MIEVLRNGYTCSSYLACYVVNRLFFSRTKKTHELLFNVKPGYTSSRARGMCLPFSLRSAFRYTKARHPNAWDRLTSRGLLNKSAGGNVLIRAFKVALLASLPANAVLNQNLLAAPASRSSLPVRASLCERAT